LDISTDDSGLGRFDKVYESYVAKCGGNGVSLRAMEDAAKQFAAETQQTKIG